METYLFFRKDEASGRRFFYPVEIKDKSHIAEHVHCNPGTYKVEDLDGKVVWSPEMTN